MAPFHPWGLLLLVLFIDISECKDHSLMVETVFEEDVVLPCFDSSEMDPKSCSRFKLIKYATEASQMKVIVARPKTSKFQDSQRVKVEADENGQISLLLTNSQKSDEGLYRCEMWQGWDCILVRNISVRVKDCKILLPVKTASSSAVSLNCPVDITSGPQNVSWAMLKGGNPASVNSNRVVINGTSLAIQSVNHTDSGWYRCQYMFGQTQRCFDIKLLIQEVENIVVATTVPALTTTSEIILEPRKERSTGGFVPVVVVSVIIGTAIMAALMGLFIHRRRNTHRVTQLTLMRPAGTLMDTAVYEGVNLTPSEDGINRVNSIYQQAPDESLCTFQY